jgi:versiconal hemiacetal acetate esterase
MLGTRPCLAGTVEEVIAQFDGLGAALAQMEYPAPDQKVTAVQSRDEKTDENITVRVYNPKEVSEGKKLPVGVYYHSGGFLLGNLNTDDPMCRVLAAHAPAIIVSVDYRKGPNFKLPVMTEDGITGFKWVR